LKKYISILSFLIVSLQISGCYVGETAALVVQTPFIVVEEVVGTTGEAAAWLTDFLIPF